MKLPNKTHPDSPVGSEHNNKVVRTFGEKPQIKNPRSHLSIGEDFDLFDF